MPDPKTIATAEATNNPGAYKTIMKSNRHTSVADEPLTVGGNDEGPAPGDYICMALSSCKAITLRMYVQRKDWNVGDITVTVTLSKADSTDGPIHTFHAEVSATSNLTDEQKERLLHIAKACPISKLLSKGSNVVTVFK